MVRSFDVPVLEFEYGVGIHGERGTARRTRRPVRDIVGNLVDTIADALRLETGSPIIALVNGLGATPPAELTSSTVSSTAVSARGA